MSESLTDRTGPQSRRGAGEARFGAKSLMQDKASCLSKWLCDPNWRGTLWGEKPNAG